MRSFHSCLLLVALAPACVEPATDVVTSSLDDDEIPTLPARASTPPLHEYEDAPRAPNADDPAIWRRSGHAPLIIGVLKDGGLEVYDLQGRIVQSLAITHRPPLAAEDPPSPGPQPDPGTTACRDSESGETYGRYNNVAIAYGFPLFTARGLRRVDLAVVTDRGCDRLRFFAIQPGTPGGPLVDITAATAPRVFPTRYVQPSALQSPGETTRVEANPVDDQSTAYGIAVYPRAGRFVAAVTQRSRSVIGLVDLYPTADGRVTYRPRAELRFDPVFRVGRSLDWTPCREDAVDDPQFEGLVYDEERRILWASQEVVGVWAIPLTFEPWGVVKVGSRHLVERVQSFGAPWWAVPDDDEWACEDEAPSPLPEGTIIARGNPAAGGEHLEADVEGLALVRDEDGEPERLLVSSQGSDGFHLFDLDDVEHEGTFRVEGVSHTDGVDIDTGLGLLVVHNGVAPPPASTEPINGYEYAESTQFVLVDWPR